MYRSFNAKRERRVDAEISALAPGAFAPEVLEGVALEQAAEELLGQVLRFLDAVAAPPNAGVQGIPIRAAEPFEGLGGGGRVPLVFRDKSLQFA